MSRLTILMFECVSESSSYNMIRIVFLPDGLRDALVLIIILSWKNLELSGDFKLLFQANGLPLLPICQYCLRVCIGSLAVRVR